MKNEVINPDVNAKRQKGVFHPLAAEQCRRQLHRRKKCRLPWKYHSRSHKHHNPERMVEWVRIQWAVCPAEFILKGKDSQHDRRQSGHGVPISGAISRATPTASNSRPR